jgi:hypothetical protein
VLLSVISLLPFYPEIALRSVSENRAPTQGFGLATRKDAKKMSIAALDSAIYDLRRKLEEDLGREIDFYEKEIESQWRETGTTYLVSWNPSRWHWETFEEDRNSTASGGTVGYSTACGHLFHAHVASHSMTCGHPGEVICEAVYS